jgi:DnaK suppressor protein
MSPEATDTRTTRLQEILERHLSDATKRIGALKRAVRQRDTEMTRSSPDAEDVAIALLQAQSKMVEAIERALLRLAEGCYGQCVHCGVPIEIRRLEALPFAIVCRKCQEALDQNERQRLRALIRTGISASLHRNETVW